MCMSDMYNMILLAALLMCTTCPATLLLCQYYLQRDCLRCPSSIYNARIIYDRISSMLSSSNVTLTDVNLRHDRHDRLRLNEPPGFS